MDSVELVWIEKKDEGRKKKGKEREKKKKKAGEAATIYTKKWRTPRRLEKKIFKAQVADSILNWARAL